MKAFATLAFLASLIYLVNQAALTPPRPPQLTLHILDVGQGDAIHLRLPNQDDVLVDAGPDDRVLAALGQVMPLGDRTIELLIISHNHADHIGGLQSLFTHYQVKQIWLSGAIHTTDQYLRILQAIKAQQISAKVVKAGDQADLGETRLDILYPPQEMTGQTPDDQHDATIVVKVSFKQFCALLTGDINTGRAKHEPEILAIAQSLDISLRCDLLKVSHHGSGSASTAGFLTAVAPKTAVISVGAKNRYGHPAPSTLERLQSAGATIYRTDRQGTITVNTDGRDYWTKGEK